MTTEGKKTISIDLPEGMSEDDFQKASAQFLTQFEKHLRKVPKKENSSKVFKTIESGPDQEIRISRDFYKGREFLSIRKWYSENGTEGFKPGKGMTFNYEEIDDIVAGLFLMKEYLEEHLEGVVEDEEEGD